MRELELLRPETVDEAAMLLRAHGYEAKLLAGGTALILMYTQGLIRPRYLICLEHVGGLNYIRHEPGADLRLGALTTHRAVERSAPVRENWPVLADAFHKVANVRVRNQATVGGVLAEADYASDPPAVLVALGARVRISGPDGERTLTVSELIQGYYETALAPDEIITEVIIPETAPGTRTAYLKFVSRSSEDRPCVGVAVLVRNGHGGVCHELRVVVGAVTGKPQQFSEVEALAVGHQLDDARLKDIGRGYADSIDPLSDMRGSSWYRKQVIAALVPRAIKQAIGDNA